MHPKEAENDPDPHEVSVPGVLAQLHKEHVIDGDAVAQLHKQPVSGNKQQPACATLQTQPPPTPAPPNGPSIDQGANEQDVTVHGSKADSLACVHRPLSTGAARKHRVLQMIPPPHTGS